MAVANGVTRKISITTKFKEKQSGRESSFFTYPYVTFSQSNGLVNATQIENYVLFERPPKPSEVGVSGASNVNGNIFVVGAKLDPTGKLVPLKENESFYLKADGTLSPLNSTSSEYVFSDAVRKELNNKSPGGLYQQSINGFKAAFQKESGLTPEQVTGIYNGILVPNPQRSGLPSLDGDSNLSPGSAESPPAPDLPPPDGATPTPGEGSLDLSTFEIRGEYEKIKTLSFGDLEYPKEIKTNGQDIVKFEILELAPRKFRENGVGLESRGTTERKIGTIYLGIQPRITDTNSVQWGDDRMNAFDMVAQGALMNFFKNAKNEKDVYDTFSKALGAVNNDESATAALSGIARAAVNSNNNLFTRLSGGIINPNVELLFQAPTLRDFPFTFAMSPRDEDEATQAKSIIRAFKQASAVQIGYQYLFLKSPFVFKISYIAAGEGENHPSLNRIKLCALKTISVDYTPSGTYMTYGAETKYTMTSYNVQLAFSELEPVYDMDYDGIPMDEIGY